MSVDMLEFQSSVANDYSSDSEIIRRNAVSRTYYSMYHLAESCLEQIIPYGNVGVHQNLIINLQQKSETNRIAIILMHAKTLRKKADYLLSENIEEAEALTIQKNFNRITSIIPQSKSA